MNEYNIYIILALATPLVVAILGYFAASGVSQGYGPKFSEKTRALTTATSGRLVSDNTAAAPRVRILGTNIPARLDHLPWSRFHTRIVVAIGATWCLVGWMTTLVGPLDPALHFVLAKPEDPGRAMLFYLSGVVLGALLFGWAADRFGRSRLIIPTIWISVLSTMATGFAWNFWSFGFCRFATGTGIGGAYVAMNLALQELIPKYYRGFTIICINSVFWAGAMLSTFSSLIIVDLEILDPEALWRAAFVEFVAVGMLGLLVVLLLFWVPESPRWLIASGQRSGHTEAERIVSSLEKSIEENNKFEYGGRALPYKIIELLQVNYTTLFGAVRLMFGPKYKKRTTLCLILMASQAFLYNIIFFNYPRHLEIFYGVSGRDISRYMLPIAFGNFVSGFLLARLFDSFGRGPMIMITYGLSGILLAITGVLFWLGSLGAFGHTVCWTAIFLVASAGASAAYLMAGEGFRLQTRAKSFAVIFATGTAIGGLGVPIFFEWMLPAEELVRRFYLFTTVAALGMFFSAWAVWYLSVPETRREAIELTSREEVREVKDVSELRHEIVRLD